MCFSMTKEFATAWTRSEDAAELIGNLLALPFVPAVFLMDLFIGVPMELLSRIKLK